MDPERWQKLRIPIRPEVDAILYLLLPMTQEDWDQLMAVLDAMKPGIVRSSAQDLPEVVVDRPEHAD